MLDKWTSDFGPVNSMTGSIASYKAGCKHSPLLYV